MVVAASTPNRQTKPDFARRHQTIHHIFGAILFINDPAFDGDSVIAIETRGQTLLRSRIRKQIARQLVDGELVERDVSVVSVDDPVSPHPLFPFCVVLIAVGIGITCQIKPVSSHMFAVG